MSMSKTVIATATKTKAATTTTAGSGPNVAASKPAAITTPRASTANVNVPKHSMVSASTSSAKLNSVDSIGNGTAESIVDAEKKIVNEFVYLLDKSKQLFNGLKDLPQCGQRNSQWQSYFGRTFDTYTKLWKFQQQNRHVLDSKYGLKRWQIGEIASKIGQLYYHYYLRTSESNYLNEAYSFYQAIQTRAYYSKVNKDEKPDLMVKKLRYLARFIVVSLLLKKDRQVHELIDELGRQIDDYVKIYDPEDQLEWQLVKNEINDFIDADTVLTIDGGATATATSPLLSIRLNASEVPQIGANPQFAHMFAHNAANAHVNPLLISPSSSSNGGGSGSGGSHHYNEHLSLQEILIVGNCNDQIKFSELSLDMYRMLQACEREPTSGSNGQNDLNEKSNNGTAAITDPTKSGNKEAAKSTGNNEETVNSSESGQRENPHKFLLYKPTFSQLYTYLSSAFKELPPHTVLMLYVSADGLESSRAALSSSHHLHLNHHNNNDSTTVSSSSYDMGGVRTNTKRDSMPSCQLAPSMNGLSLVGGGGHNSDSLHRRSSSYHFKDTHCIYPGDLYAFTRKPIFLIIDSLNSNAFRNFPNLFGQPFLSFMSPVILPSVFLELQNQNGSIFTLFLVNPLQAFCYICNITDINSETFQKAKIQLKVIFIEIARAIHKSKQLDHVILQYCHDDFMRSFILRFVFCYCSLRLHRAFKGPDYYPSSQPTFSSDVIESRHIHKLVIDLSLILNSRQLYLDVTADDL